MDRMGFIPGSEARLQMRDANGLIYFTRPAVLDFADTFILQVPGGMDSKLAIVYQCMLACMSEGERVDIHFGLDDPTLRDREFYPPAEGAGVTRAVFTSHDGKERILWEVGRDTVPLGDGFARKGFNAYREALAMYRGEGLPTPMPIHDGKEEESDTGERKESENGRPPSISRALSPMNLLYCSGATWYFVDLAPPGDATSPAVLSRPMRAFDAVVLAACMTLAMGSPPLVFGMWNDFEVRGEVPRGFRRVQYPGLVEERDPSVPPLVL